jgi:hypothetical protein
MSTPQDLKNQIEQLTGYSLGGAATTSTAPSGTIPTEGITPGGIIQSNQILNIINALNGVNVDTIIISGSFNTSGSNTLNGTLALPFIQDGNYLYVTGGLVVGRNAIASASFAVSSSHATSASLAETASYVEVAQTASYVLNAVTSSISLLGVITASASANTITFTKGDQTTFSVTVSQSGSVESASYAAFAKNAGTASIAVSSSYALNADYLDGQDSTVFATTGSNTFKGNQTISGSLIPFGLTSDLGSLSNPWKHFYVSTGSMYFVSASTIVGSFSGTETGVYVSGTLSASIITADSITASLFGTSSYAITASNAIQANTASYALNAVSASYTVSASYAPVSTSGSYALSSSFALTASYALNVPTQSVSASYALTASLPLLGIVTASVAASTITFTKGDSTTFDITIAQSGSVQSASYALFAQNAGTASIAVSSSYALSASYALSSSYAVTSSYANNSTSASYALSASYAPGSGTAISASYAASSSHADTASIANIQYVTNSIVPLGQIQVLDYSDSVATTYVNGLLTFVFGTPAAPSALAESFNGTFLTDRFNQVLDNYTVSASWIQGGYTLISASIYEGATQLANTGTGTNLNYTATTSGSHTYILQVTSSNPLDQTINQQSVSLSGTLSKTNPGTPTISATPVMQLGAASNQIEEGATGSITFTSASGASNGWVFNYETSNVQSPYIVTGSLTGSAAISLTTIAYYSSSGAGGSDNNPPLSTSTTTTTTYSKIRSLRSGATLNSSYSPTQLENLSDWDTTLGGTVGTIKKGTLNPSGQPVTINWTGSLYQYIVYDSAYANLTAINSSGFNISSSFTLTITGSYKVYRSTAVQAGYGGTTVTYTLI